MKKKIKLHFGCGEVYLEDYINCDILTSLKTDKLFDLDIFPYPFKKDYADEILMTMLLEHVEDVFKVMEEVHRILKNNGTVRIYVPYAKGDWAYQDPTHKQFFTEKSMNFFLKNDKYSFYTHARFSLIKADLYTSTDTFLSRLRNLIPFRKLLRHFLFNMYDAIYFELKAIK